MFPEFAPGLGGEELLKRRPLPGKLFGTFLRNLHLSFEPHIELDSNVNALLIAEHHAGRELRVFASTR